MCIRQSDDPLEATTDTAPFPVPPINVNVEQKTRTFLISPMRKKNTGSKSGHGSESQNLGICQMVLNFGVHQQLPLPPVFVCLIMFQNENPLRINGFDLYFFALLFCHPAVFSHFDPQHTPFFYVMALFINPIKMALFSNNPYSFIKFLLKMAFFSYSNNYSMLLLVILLPCLLGFEKMAEAGNFYQDVDVTWGDGRGKILDNGNLLTLSLDKASGSGFQSKKQYLNGRFDMKIKLVPANSAGTVTAYYVTTLLICYVVYITLH